MRKDWRQTQWGDFSTPQKSWFCILCILLVLVLIIAGLSTSETVKIPDWIGIIIVTAGVFAVCKFLQITPWALKGMEPDCEEEDEIDEDDN